MTAALVAHQDQTAADALRLGCGMLAYCPVCGRPSANDPGDAHGALWTIARHLRTDHDNYFAATFAVYLGRPL